MNRWLSCLPIVLIAGSRLDAAPVNDAFESPIVLRGEVAHGTGATTVGATAQSGEPGHGGQPAVRSVWWFWGAPARGEALLDFSGTGFAMRVGVYRGKELASLAPIPLRTNVDVPGLLRFDAEAGVEYQIAVDGQGSGSGPVDFSLRLVRTPEILRAPEAVSAYETQGAVLQVQAAGRDLGYRWLLNGSVLGGERNAELRLARLQLAQAGDYQAIVTNHHGAVTSGVARLTVRPAIALAEALDTPAWEWRTDGIAPWFGQGEQARDGVDAARAGMNLRAFESSWIESTVAGPARLSFWWRLAGSAGDELAVDVGFATRHVLRGTTPWQNQSVEIPSGSHTVRWLYRKDSGAGAVTDGAWLDEVRVVPVAPSIQTPPRSTTNCLGAIAMFTVTAVGTPPLQYQWLLNGAEILGANGASLVITNLVPGLAGDYSVRVTNPAGAVESPRARLVLKSGRTMELAEALDWAGPAPRSGPLNEWYGQDCESYDGIDAARSAAIGHGGVSSMELEVAGPGTLQFWWRVSSESSDYAEVRVDGQMRMRVSGERGWESRSLSVEEGTHRIEWRYVKNGTGSAGQDAAWVDQVRFLPAPPSVVGPYDVTVCVGESVTLSAEVTGFPPLRSRWQKNRVDIPGMTGTELRLTSMRVSDAGAYRLVVTNAVGTVVSREARVRVIECVPLPEALDATELTWTTSPSRPWHGQTTVAHDGVDAAQSGVIGDSEQSWIETRVEGPGLLDFWWRSSSEQCCDKLRLFVNGIEVAVAPQQWEQHARSLPAGPVSLRWVYAKDSSISSGDDAAWVDRVTFRPQHTAPEIVTQPPDRVTVCSGGTLELAVEAVGRVPIEYEWRKDGVLLTSSGSILRLESVVAGHAGVYTVRVSNALGATDSRPTVVTVTGEDDITLSEALDARHLEFETGGSPTWRGQSCVTHDGVDAAASVRAPPNSQGWIETRVQGPGHLGFWWRVLGDYSDRLVLRTNNVTALTLRGDVREWQRAGIGLAPGEQVIRWTYERAGSTANEDTGAWLDEIELATVPMLPQITEEPPARVAACAGTRMELAVSADGTAPLHYRWHHNGIPIEGATSRTWAVDQAVPSHSGVYEVHISNALGEVRSRATLVEILPSDGILLSEALDTGLTLIQRGAAAWVGQACVTHDGVDAARSGAIGHREESSMETTIEGPGLLGYWWMADSETGWDKLEFLVEDRVVRAAPQRSWQWVTHDLGPGTHRVRWRYTKDGSGSFGADAGYVDQLVFVRHAGPPVLAAEPHAVSTCEGGRAEFGVLAGGLPPLDFRWTRNGVPLTGGDEPTLVLTNVTASMAGVYVVTVANALGVVTSAPAILEVLGDGGIDLQTALDAPDLEFTTHPVRPWVGGACVSHDGVDAAHTVDLPIDQPSWIETRLVGPGYLSFWWRVEGHAFDEVGVSLNGTTRSTLRPQAGRWTRGVLSVPDGTNTVRWTHRRWTFSTSASGRAWLDEVEYRPSRVPARILEQPLANLTACRGTDAELRVRAVGTPPLAYQWFKDGLAIAGATGPILTRSNLVMADAGEYRVRVTNHLGQDISAPAGLRLLASDGIPLAEALDIPGFELTTSGPVAWVGQACETHDGMDAAALRDVPAGSRCELATRIAGPGRLTFWWRTDAHHFDSLRLEIGGVRLAEVAGSGAWRQASVEVPAGGQLVRWIFERPSYSSGPARAAFLDEVSWAPYDAPPTIASGEPANASPCPGETAVLSANVSGWPVPDLRWFFNGRLLVGETGKDLVLRNPGAADAGQYQLVASNRFGAVTSRVAVVALRACVSLPEALDAPDLAWTTGGDAPWFGQRVFSRDARHAAQSGRIGHDQESWLETVVEGPGTLIFSWAVTSQDCCDRLEFIVDGVPRFLVL